MNLRLALAAALAATTLYTPAKAQKVPVQEPIPNEITQSEMPREIDAPRLEDLLKQKEAPGKDSAETDTYTFSTEADLQSLTEDMNVPFIRTVAAATLQDLADTNYDVDVAVTKDTRVGLPDITSITSAVTDNQTTALGVYNFGDPGSQGLTYVDAFQTLRLGSITGFLNAGRSLQEVGGEHSSYAGIGANTDLALGENTLTLGGSAVRFDGASLGHIEGTLFPSDDTEVYLGAAMNAGSNQVVGSVKHDDVGATAFHRKAADGSTWAKAKIARGGDHDLQGIYGGNATRATQLFGLPPFHFPHLPQTQLDGENTVEVEYRATPGNNEQSLVILPGKQLHAGENLDVALGAGPRFEQNAEELSVRLDARVAAQYQTESGLGVLLEVEKTDDLAAYVQLSVPLNY